MTEFYSLPDFLMLQEDLDFPIRGRALQGPEWLSRYTIAKAQWQEYKDSPPLKSVVGMLVNGAGCGFPFLKYNTPM